MKSTKNPHPFEVSKLINFQFGDPEARNDDVLLNCFQPIKGVREFLSGNKNIILGERGVGKSALFRLVCDEKCKFAQSKNETKKQIIIGIDDELNYISILNLVETKFIDKTKTPHSKYRFLWETYIFSRIIESLTHEFGIDTELKTLQEDFGEILGISKEQKFRLSDIFTLYKYTTGVKFEQNGSVSPNFSIEPAKDAHIKPTEISYQQLIRFKERVRQAIKARKCIIHVLVDRVDDFVVDLEYEEQKKSVQALLECTQDLRYPDLKLKIFLRTDLFRRLNFQKGGFDKISHQVTKLEWSENDIYEFVARRLLFNYEQNQIKTPNWQISTEALDIDPMLYDQERELILKRSNGFSEKSKWIGMKFLISVKRRLSLFRKKSHSERKINSLDAIFQEIVEYIIPKKIRHTNCNCKYEDISFRLFLTQHFKLGSNHSNPRLVLLFLTKTFENAIDYYQRNPDKKHIPHNDLNQLELILKEHITRGYNNLQQTTRETIIKLNEKWSSNISNLISNQPKPKSCENLSKNILLELTKWTDDTDEFRRFIAFYSHIGLLVPDNDLIPFEDRKYSIPTIIRKC